MKLFLSYAATGLLQGFGFAAIAIGLTLVYGVLHLLNFATGIFALLGAYLAYFAVTSLGLNFALAVLAAGVGLLAIGYVSAGVVIIPMKRRRASELWMMLGTVGLGLVLQEILEVTVGDTPKSIPLGLATKAISPGGVFLNDEQLVSAGVAIVLITALHLGVHRTRLGKQSRAVAQNPSGAVLSGISVNRVYAAGFAVSAAVAGIAGALVLGSSPITPGAGIDLTITAFVVVIAGGLGSFWGATIMGLAIGLVQGLAAGYWSPAYAPLVGYVFLVCILLVRPRGIFAHG
jgi:branched-chain amino acid transport system permease protein